MNEIAATKNTALAANLQDRFKALRAQAATAPETWEPVAGECLVGQLIGHQRASGVYGENFQILIKDENGNVTAAWLTQWLKEKLSDAMAAIRERGLVALVVCHA